MPMSRMQTSYTPTKQLLSCLTDMSQPPLAPSPLTSEKVERYGEVEVEVLQEELEEESFIESPRLGLDYDDDDDDDVEVEGVSEPRHLNEQLQAMHGGENDDDGIQRIEDFDDEQSRVHVHGRGSGDGDAGIYRRLIAELLGGLGGLGFEGYGGDGEGEGEGEGQGEGGILLMLLNHRRQDIRTQAFQKLPHLIPHCPPPVYTALTTHILHHLHPPPFAPAPDPTNPPTPPHAIHTAALSLLAHSPSHFLSSLQAHPTTAPLLWLLDTYPALKTGVFPASPHVEEEVGKVVRGLVGRVLERMEGGVRALEVCMGLVRGGGEVGVRVVGMWLGQLEGEKKGGGLGMAGKEMEMEMGAGDNGNGEVSPSLSSPESSTVCTPSSTETLGLGAGAQGGREGPPFPPPQPIPIDISKRKSPSGSASSSSSTDAGSDPSGPSHSQSHSHSHRGSYRPSVFQVQAGAPSAPRHVGKRRRFGGFRGDFYAPPHSSNNKQPHGHHYRHYHQHHQHYAHPNPRNPSLHNHNHPAPPPPQLQPHPQPPHPLTPPPSATRQNPPADEHSQNVSPNPKPNPKPHVPQVGYGYAGGGGGKTRRRESGGGTRVLSRRASARSGRDGHYQSHSHSRGIGGAGGGAGEGGVSRGGGVSTTANSGFNYSRNTLNDVRGIHVQGGKGRWVSGCGSADGSAREDFFRREGWLR